jgi:DNA-directed RNA polymerase subunit RPC12/RpoP
MEKYGVHESNESSPPAKMAGEGTLCPRCGSRLRRPETTGVLLCPKCGSKPFEEQHGP